AGRQHLMDRVEAAAEQAVLRPVGVERNTERENLAGANEARGLDDVLRRDLVQRADVVVFAPAAPILELLRGRGDRLFSELDVHRNALPFPWCLTPAAVRGPPGDAASV